MAPSLPPQIQLLQMATANWVSQSIYAAAKLGLADQLQAEPQSCDRLAELTHTHAPFLYRLLRALVSLGVFSQTSTGEFALTPVGEFLRSDVPGSLRAMAVMQGEEHYHAWGDIVYSLQAGENAFTHLYGMDIFTYLGQHPASAQIFDQAMTSFSSIEIPAVMAAYDFSGLNTIVDVAGGHGSLLATILQAYPQSQGILFDQEAVIAGAKPQLTQAGVLDRCQLVGGSFFETVPGGGDAYLLKHIVHDWGDESAIAILKNCRQAMGNSGKVLVIEQVIPPGNGPATSKLLDLNMMVMCSGGKERTAAEYQILFEQAGFHLNRIVSTPAEISVLEGIPA
uniref:O-methyltransferase family 2 n=1 Tax=Cyanothece sp. (strain PCC 7425 / ATCC 29141) TaxID=395961 RepID=B8HV33_CYAP4